MEPFQMTGLHFHPSLDLKYTLSRGEVKFIPGVCAIINKKVFTFKGFWLEQGALGLKM